MLRELYVSGFKSLTKFTLEIHHGLNVLVGPNGAGKTNLIRFLEFLSYLPRNSLSEAVSRAGGAGEIFTKTGLTTIERTISVKIRGHGSYPDLISKTNDLQYTIYELDFAIHFSGDDNTLYYEYQNVHLSSFSKKPKLISYGPKWQLA
jgi:predicted ATPase